MSMVCNGIGVSDISDELDKIQVSVDLVTAARRHLVFLKAVAESQWLYTTFSLRQAIKRYDELWMPLISQVTVGGSSPILLPPLDVQWVWHCHTLSPVRYRQYCEVKFSKMIEKPVISDDGNEEFALNRCYDLWSCRYPFEPFEMESICDDEGVEIVTNEELLKEVLKCSSLYSKFNEPYMLELVYLIAAKERYKRFMYLLEKFKDGHSRFTPTLDIQLMWLTHMSYPLIYAKDVKKIEGELGNRIGIWDTFKDEDVEGSKKLWEEVFDEPYEKAGAMLDCEIAGSLKPPVYLVVSDTDVNSKYKCMEPRFLLEVCIFVKEKVEVRHSQDKENEYLRLRMLRCHKEMKMDKDLTFLVSNTWRKACHLYSEFGTRGVILELRRCGKSCLKSNVRSTIVFLWNDLIRAPCLTVGKELGKKVRLVASIVPPVQAPYLLKCVPDRVTDDSGAMISDVILEMNRYRPQEGRWLSRTVLDRAGRECFVLRIRYIYVCKNIFLLKGSNRIVYIYPTDYVGSDMFVQRGRGIWRRGGEIPIAVKWEDRIIEVREGSWAYVAGSIGKIPEKVAGTATPREHSKDKATWSLSTGDELTIHWVSSGLTLNLQNRTSSDSVRLLKGRKMQYQVMNKVSCKPGDKQAEEEDAFVTLVRYTPGNPNGRATALMNWRLLVVEFLPEEDAVMVLLICMAILRTVTEMVGQDMGNLLVRRRLKEHTIGMRDWGSVVILPSSMSSPSSPISPYLQPWHWNASVVMASVEADQNTRQSSPAEGGDKLYKTGIIPGSKGGLQIRGVSHVVF
ncbi:hypothetical protein IFM89_001383 [Coptis chinensis]|uniref:GRPD C-terminal domain-containing protein n=1 Tax=Coptis chinensis TaxID=261450 RepID=A0A835HTH9_9MAGN|nr:hypothetical protein IFM89_001383 [Coptis chinensis]